MVDKDKSACRVVRSFPSTCHLLPSFQEAYTGEQHLQHNNSTSPSSLSPPPLPPPPHLLSRSNHTESVYRAAEPMSHQSSRPEAQCDEGGVHTFAVREGPGGCGCTFIFPFFRLDKARPLTRTDLFVVCRVQVLLLSVLGSLHLRCFRWCASSSSIFPLLPSLHTLADVSSCVVAFLTSSSTQVRRARLLSVCSERIKDQTRCVPVPLPFCSTLTRQLPPLLPI